VLIANHGAAASEEFLDADGTFCESVRAIVGVSCVVGACLDMHANLSALVVDSTDICVVWRTTPHLDMFVRGQKTAQLLVAAMRGEIRPVQWIETPPLIMNITQHFTASEPMRSLCNDAVAANERPGILDTSVAQGYPYGDVPQLGMAWVAIADGDLDAARAAAQWMAGRAWEKRKLLCAPPRLSPADAVREADQLYIGRKPPGENNAELFSPRGPDHGMNFVPENGSSLEEPSESNEHAHLGPVVIMDIGDNIGGGSTADSTFLLHEALAQGLDGFLLTLKDPEAVAACISAGVGATLTLDVGGKTDSLHGAPVTLTGLVLGLSDGKWEDRSPTHGGGRFYSAGHCACFEAGGVTVVLTERQVRKTPSWPRSWASSSLLSLYPAGMHGPTCIFWANLTPSSLQSGNTSRGQFYQIGVQPEEHRILVAKGVQSPRPAYQPIASHVLMANTPGITSADLTSFQFEKRRVPLYPLEVGAAFRPRL
jgi:microcystin degradation protein MlrC